jgi:hypothetical protein
MAAGLLFVVYNILDYDGPDSPSTRAGEEKDLKALIDKNYRQFAPYSPGLRSLKSVSIHNRNATITFVGGLPPRGDYSEVGIWFDVYRKWHNGKARCVTADYRSTDGDSRREKSCGGPTLF